MARNWDQAASGGLGTLIDAYNSGQDRARNWDKDLADRAMKADEFIAQHAPYKKATRDRRGLVNGLEHDASPYDQDEQYFGLAKDPNPPAAPTPAPAPVTPPAPPAPAPMQDLTSPDQPKTASGRPIGKEYLDETGDRHPDSGPGKPDLKPGDPTPLLRDPKAALPVKETVLPSGQKAALAAGTDSVQYDPRKAQPAGKTPDGKDLSVIPADKTTTSFDQDLSVTGTKDEPAAQVQPTGGGAPVPAPTGSTGKLHPSDFAMKRLVERDTAVPRAAGGLPVDVNNLTPDMREMLGVTPEMLAAHVKIPSNIVNAMMGGEYKLGVQSLKNEGAGASGVDPIAVPILEQVEAGNLPAMTGLGMALRQSGGRLSKATEAAFYKAAGIKNQDRGAGLRSDKFEQGKKDKVASISGPYVQKAMAETKLDLESLNTFKTLDNMLQRKDTNGLRKLIPIMIERGFIPQRLTNQMVSADTGLAGWGDKLDQWIEGVDTGAITPANVNFFRSLVHDGMEEKRTQYNQKMQRWKRAGIGALMEHGLNEDEASAVMDRSLDPNAIGGSHAPSSAAAPAKPKFVPTKDENALRKEMMLATSSIRKAGGDKAAVQRIKDAFKAKTGIEWDPKGGPQ
jgi:hypothetical protein